jgi:hypothetical protein
MLQETSHFNADSLIVWGLSGQMVISRTNSGELVEAELSGAGFQMIDLGDQPNQRSLGE